MTSYKFLRKRIWRIYSSWRVIYACPRTNFRQLKVRGSRTAFNVMGLNHVALTNYDVLKITILGSQDRASWQIPCE